VIRWSVRSGTQVGDNVGVDSTDRGIEELLRSRGEEQVSLARPAERLREFVDLNPEFETATEPCHLAGRPRR
jgi:hypothetical protein